MGDRLVGHWCPSFTGPSSLHVQELSGQSNHGAFSGMDANTAWVTSGGKGAISFGGGTQAVQTRNTITWGSFDIFCFTAWINPTNTTGTKGFIGVDTNGQGPEFRLNGTQLNFLNQGALNLVTNAGAVSASTWSCVGINYNNRTFAYETFINGRIVSTGTGANGFTISNLSKMQISAGAVSDAWSGFIDDVRLYGRALSSSQISAMYDLERAGGMLSQPYKRRSYRAAGFKAYWHRRQSQVIGGGLR